LGAITTDLRLGAPVGLMLLFSDEKTFTLV